MSNKNILITGATGTIGREILSQLNASNALKGVTVFARHSRRNRKFLSQYSRYIKIIYGDIRYKKDVLRACKGQDIVIHLAAILPTFPGRNPALTEEINFRGTENIVSALEEASPNATLLFSSSIAVYGDRLKNPVIQTSDQLHVNENDAYANAKVMAEARIQNSNLKWSIFRLSVIMGIGNHKLSEKMFEMPLETPLEIATVRDTARAFVHAMDKLPLLEKKIFNLGGGKNCRISYLEFLEKAFQGFGLGKVDFPEFAFAKRNFHCGHFDDGDALEEILHFRMDDINSYFKRFNAAIPKIQKLATIPFSRIVKRYLLGLSKPYKAFKNGDMNQMEFFFGPAK